MSLESAVAYLTRMRQDEAFRKSVNDCEDEGTNWAFVAAAGYAFTLDEFKRAQERIYQEHGITPL